MTQIEFQVRMTQVFSLAMRQFIEETNRG
jgi:hypothetical protein